MFTFYFFVEALNQGETVDLDALMADLCSIEQELSSIGSQSSKNTLKSHERRSSQKPPAGRTSSKQSSLRGLPSSSGRITKPSHANFSLDDITAQLEQASLSMDEAARQTAVEDAKPAVTIHHRRTASAGTVSDSDIRSVSNSSRSSVTSAASSMDSLDIDKMTRPQELDLIQGQPISEVRQLKNYYVFVIFASHSDSLENTLYQLTCMCSPVLDSCLRRRLDISICATSQ